MRDYPLRHERAPALVSAWRSGSTRDHVPPDCTARVVDAELGGELLHDPVLTPLRVVSGDSLDEVDVFEVFGLYMCVVFVFIFP